MSVSFAGGDCFTNTVIPAKAGIQVVTHAQRLSAVLRTEGNKLDSGLRQNDEVVDGHFRENNICLKIK